MAQHNRKNNPPLGIHMRIEGTMYENINNRSHNNRSTAVSSTIILNT
jgi:hypothetical protein